MLANDNELKMAISRGLPLVVEEPRPQQHDALQEVGGASVEGSGAEPIGKSIGKFAIKSFHWYLSPYTHIQVPTHIYKSLHTYTLHTYIGS